MERLKMICLIGLVGLAIVVVHKSARAGDPVIGCPLGVEKGKVWLFSRSFYTNATRAYWNENPGEAPKMVQMPGGWHARIFKSSFRTEFGVTDRLSAGILLTYWDKDISKDVWKKKPNGDSMRKQVAFRAHGFGDIWLFGLFKLVKDHPVWESIAIGAGGKLDAADNSLVVHGIGSGAKAYRFALLSHSNIKRNVHAVTDLWYEHRGKIRNIMVKNDQGQPVKWGKSGQDIGDAFGYKLGVEVPLGKEGHWRVVPFLSGWKKFRDKNAKGEEIKYTDYYEHFLVFMFQYLPLGEEHEHSKFMIGVKVPIKSMNSFSATFMPQLGAMWTF